MYSGEDMVGMSDYDMLVESVLWLFNNNPIEFQINNDKYYSNAYTKGEITIPEIMEYTHEAMRYKTGY